MKDKRYSIRLEFCGYPKPRFVVRFCGTWIGQRDSRAGAELLAQQYEERRLPDKRQLSLAL